MASDAIDDACVRENRISTHLDAKFRRVAGLSLGAVTLGTAFAVTEPPLGVTSLTLNAAFFGFLQGCFHQ